MVLSSQSVIVSNKEINSKVHECLSIINYEQE